MQLRRSHERGHANHGWLDSYHTFSFADYHDPAHMGFRALRVINEDRVAGGGGFPPHPHRDMEILSYVLGGALEHRDSMGNGSVLHYGDVQRMTAGTGVVHSEFNASKTDPVHFLQIWVIPEARNIRPGYEEKHFEVADKRGQLRLVASRDGRDGSVVMHQDLSLYAGIFSEGQGARYTLTAGRHAWLHVARGRIKLGGEVLSAGDAASFSPTGAPEVIALDGADHESEVLLFDLA